MRPITSMSLGMTLALTLADGAFAQTPANATAQGPTQGAAATTTVKVTEEKPGLLKQAKISADAALASARAKVPGGVFKSAEIEKEDGKLVYSFNFTTKGKPGEDEVLVDALTGAVIKTEHESPEQEAKEAKEAKESTGKSGAKASTSKPPHKGSTI